MTTNKDDIKELLLDPNEWNKWRRLAKWRPEDHDRDGAVVVHSGPGVTKEWCRVVDLAHVKLADMDLTRHNLRSLNLTGVDFSKSNLIHVDFERSNLDGAIFDDANLDWANLGQVISFRSGSLLRIQYNGATTLPPAYRMDGCHIERSVVEDMRSRNDWSDADIRRFKIHEEPRPTPPSPIRIFLASSAELRKDRDDFELYFRQQNDQLRKQGLYLEIIRWENFLDAMSAMRLQDEYNKQIRACDIFVCLFFTKTGTFTEEEFDTAHCQFQAHGKPRIYTFFKNAAIMTGDARKEDLMSLWAFQEKLRTLGHFYTRYDNIEHLKRQFRDQLDKMREEHDAEQRVLCPPSY